LKSQPFIFTLLIILALIYGFIIIAFHITSTLSIDLIILSSLGLIIGTYGLLRSYPTAIYLSILIMGFLLVVHSIYDGDIVYIILISTVLVAFFYAQHFLMYSSRILQGIKGQETAMLTRKVVRSSVLKIIFIAASTFLMSFILLNLSVFSSLGFTNVWTVLILAILFLVLSGLLIALPRGDRI